MDNRRVKFCLKIFSRFGKIIKKPQGVNFFGAPCKLGLYDHCEIINRQSKQSTEWAIKSRPPTCQLIMSSNSNVHLK